MKLKLLIFTFLGLFAIEMTHSKVVNKQTQKATTKKASKSVSEVLASAKELKNQKVRVTGKITKVCPMAGCWIDIQDPQFKNDPSKTLHVKVKDGEIVFPKDSPGKMVTVDGTLIEKKLNRKKAIKHFKHRAEELGIPFDEKSITGPVTLWELKGVAAEIKK